MPELPEVESIRLGLMDLVGSSLKSLRVIRTDNLQDPNSLPLTRLRGQSLNEIQRRGKYLLFIWRDYKLLVHLGMSGVWRLNSPKVLHTHLVMNFSDGSVLSYTDPRRFGYWCLDGQERSNPRWNALGPDAIDRSFNSKLLFERIQGSRVDIKTWILDQHHVAGVGNIYASEALFLAGIHPLRLAGSLSPGECSALVKSIKSVMRLSLKHKGTTFSDYRLTNGKGGAFQSYLKVFQKEGQSCPSCGYPIIRIVQFARSTFFCAQCQPRSR